MVNRVGCTCNNLTLKIDQKEGLLVWMKLSAAALMYSTLLYQEIKSMGTMTSVSVAHVSDIKISSMMASRKNLFE